MSMIGRFALISQARYTDLLRHPETVEAVVHPEDRDISKEPDFHSVHKWWHGIHYLLNRKAWEGERPLDFIVVGGSKVGDIDVGYGPARAFSPNDLAAIARALEPMTEDVLRARFDPNAAEQEQIYPLHTRMPAYVVGQLLGEYLALKSFLAAGADHGLGLIVWLD